MELLPAGESARRIRAAKAYAGIDYAEIERRTGINAHTVRGYAREKNPQPVPNSDYLREIARACEIPEAFMFEGFGKPADELAELHRDVSELRQAVVALSAGVSLEGLEPDEIETLLRWRRRSASPTEGEEPGSQTRGEG